MKMKFSPTQKLVVGSIIRTTLYSSTLDAKTSVSQQKSKEFHQIFYKCYEAVNFFFTPWRSSTSVGSPREPSRAIRSRDRATVGQQARRGRGLWSSCLRGLMGNSSGWRSGSWSGQGPGSRRFLWCSSSPEVRKRAAVKLPGPAGRSSCLRVKGRNILWWSVNTHIKWKSPEHLPWSNTTWLCTCDCDLPM